MAFLSFRMERMSMKQIIFRHSFVMACCCLALVSPAAAPTVSSGDCADPGETPRGSKSVPLPIDLAVVMDEQKAFDDGHQPWRGDQRSVAAAVIATVMGSQTTVNAEALNVECDSSATSTVVGRDATNLYRVHLKRLVGGSNGRPGIWTAVRLVISPDVQ